MGNYEKFWDRWHDLSFDNHTLTTNDPDRIKGRYANQTITTLLRHLNLDKLSQMTILDYGCGTGRLGLLLAPLVKKYLCVDISPKMLRTAANNLGKLDANLEFYTPESLKLSKDSIDFTFSYASLSYESSEREFWRIVKEIDFFSVSFSINLHGVANKKVSPGGKISRNPLLDIFKVQGYRPTEDEIKRRYATENYLVEFHKPDVRQTDIFFYKVASEHLKTYLMFGPHSDYQFKRESE